MISGQLKSGNLYIWPKKTEVIPSRFVYTNKYLTSGSLDEKIKANDPFIFLNLMDRSNQDNDNGFYIIEVIFNANIRYIVLNQSTLKAILEC